MRKTLPYLTAMFMVASIFMAMSAVNGVAAAKPDNDRWCCVDGEVAKVSPRDCKKRRGQCYKSQKAAKRECYNKESKELNKKIEALIGVLKLCDPPKGVNRLAKMEKLSKADKLTIQQMLRDQKYKSKVIGLRRESQRLLEQVNQADKLTSFEKIVGQTNKLIDKFSREREQKIHKMNMEVRQRVKELRDKHGKLKGGPSAIESVPLMPITEAMQRLIDDDYVEATVSSPRIVREGEGFTIRGSGFGDSRGRVVLILETPPNRGSLVDLPIQEWSDNSITVQWPSDFHSIPCCDYMGPGYIFPHEQQRSYSEATPVTLWVKLAGGEMGPTKEVQLRPTVPSSYPEPRIVDVSPRNLTNGSEFYIHGRHFCSFAYGCSCHEPSLRFFIHHLRWRELDVEILDIGPNYIHARIPESVGPFAWGLGYQARLKLWNCFRERVEYGGLSYAHRR